MEHGTKIEELETKTPDEKVNNFIQRLKVVNSSNEGRKPFWSAVNNYLMGNPREEQSLLNAKQPESVVRFTHWMARKLGENGCGKLLWLWEFCESDEMGLDCDGSDITAVGAVEALVK